VEGVLAVARAVPTGDTLRTPIHVYEDVREIKMAPRLQRPGHPYVQIADHYRTLIADGALRPGTRLPTVTAIADEWGVSPGTAHKAVRLLAAEKLVEPTQQGTWIRDTRATSAPRDRLLEVRRGNLIRLGRQVMVTAAHVVTAPGYVVDVLGMTTDEVVRRETITYQHDETPIMLSVVWLPAAFVESAPGLTSFEPLDEVEHVRDSTGRVVTHGRDWVTGRDADDREARALRLQVGTPITAGTWLWSDEDGAIEYGEYVLPPNHVVTYEYRVDGP